MTLKDGPAEFINKFRGRKFSAFIAPKDFEAALAEELALLGIELIFKTEQVFFVTEESLAKAKRKPIWAQDFWPECGLMEVVSIKKTQVELKKIASRWVHAGLQCHRRGELILEGLPGIQQKRLTFLQNIKRAPYGIFALLDEKNLFYCENPQSVVPLCFHEFEEDKAGPPSRAYLKLWETFTIHDPEFARALKGQKVVDMGACPGGWSWVLQKLGAQVHAYDKAPLDAKVATLPGIHFHQESAFGVVPEKGTDVMAFFSDIICYPARLYELVEKWREAGVKNFVCSIKFQKEADYATVEKFLAIPGSHIVHLYHNKNEVTWILLDA